MFPLRFISVILLVLSISAQSRCHQQPHIVLIMADDMGWNDVSFHGSDQIQTPNIDTLAAKGVVLQQYYSETICTPARTALLTGKYPMRLGMHGTPLYNSEDRGIPLTEKLLPSYLKSLGYSTHLVGKWHVGMSRNGYLPTNRGYDTHYGLRGGFIDYYTHNLVESWPDGRIKFGLDLFDGFIPQDQEQHYIIDLLTERAINIIATHNTTRPLFLHIAHNAPHAGNNGAPLQPPLNSTGVGNMHIANSDRRLYADVVASLDRSIGEVVKALADKDILDNTLIVFLSDNGAPTVGQYKNWGINLPFRGKKDTPWEGGARVPALIWHSSLKPQVWNGLMHITDLLPTLTAAAGGVIDEDIDGVNQWESIVQGGDSNRKEILIAVGDSTDNVYAAYRAGDYKIVVGNVTGLFNDYYGAEFLPNKADPPNYYEQIRKSETARALESLGLELDISEVKAMREATQFKTLNTTENSTLCEPTSSKGCLFNLIYDPSESQDIWDDESAVASELNSRLEALWEDVLRRGTTKLMVESDPANFNYTWHPWLTDEGNVEDTSESVES